jgi:hypothetical protein
MKVDSTGNVYCGGAGGLWIMDSGRQEAGPHRARRSRYDQPGVRRCRLETLYFTSRNHLGAVNVKIPGIPVPTAQR